jgi:thymidylate kinase
MLATTLALCGVLFVILTGAPGAGKSSCLHPLKKRLEELGYRVLTVKECATPLFESCGGFDPQWAGRQQQLEMQSAFLDFQLSQEFTAQRLAALRPAEPTIILCDRGAADGYAFCSAAGWADILRGASTNMETLMRRYHVILDLQTVAALDGGRLYSFGQGSQNESRFHNAQEALDLAPRFSEAYGQHPRYTKVQATPDFADKVSRCLELVLAATPDDMRRAAQQQLASRPAARMPPPPARPAAASAQPGPSAPGMQPSTYEALLNRIDQLEKQAQEGAQQTAVAARATDAQREADANRIDQLEKQAQDGAQQTAAAARATDAQREADAQAAAQQQADHQGLQAALTNGHGIRVRQVGEALDLAVDPNAERFGTDYALDIDEPLAPAEEQQQRHTILMAALQQEWPARQALGINGITPDLQSGTSGRALAAFGVGMASAYPIGSRALHQLGLNGSPWPAGAPANDKSLLRHPATLSMFYAPGVFKRRSATKTFKLATSESGELRFADGTTTDMPNPSATCRVAFLVADMRLSWLMSIPDPAHPHFLPLEMIGAARQYNWWIGLQELFCDFADIEQLDAQLMFDRFNGTWDFDMPVQPMLMASLSQRRSEQTQQCLICQTSGHCMDRCPKVTGTTLPRRGGGAGYGGNDTGGGGGRQGGGRGDGNANGGGGKRNRGGKGAAKGKGNRGKGGACYDWNNGHCTRQNCGYNHVCLECGGGHTKTNCTQNTDIDNAKAAAGQGAGGRN